MNRPRVFFREYFTGDRPSPASFLIAQFLVPAIVVYSGATLYSWMALQVYHLWALFAFALLFTVLFVFIMSWACIGSFRASLKHKAGDEINIPVIGPFSIKRALIITSLAILLKPMAQPPVDAMTISYFLIKESALTDTSSVSLMSAEVLLVSGGITESIYSEFSRLLRENPSMRMVLLESEGGSVYWAKKMADQISARGLITHVNDVCLSSCAIAMLAGKQRTASFYAKVGVHQGYNSIWGVDSNRDSMTNYFRDRGMSAGFVRRVALYDSTDMLYPSREELIREGFVTQYTMPHFLFPQDEKTTPPRSLPTGYPSNVVDGFIDLIGEKRAQELQARIDESKPLSIEQSATLFNKMLLFSIDRHAVRNPDSISALYLKSRTKPYQFQGLFGPMCELYKTGLFTPSVFFDSAYNADLNQALTLYIQHLLAGKKSVPLSFEEKDPFDITCR